MECICESCVKKDCADRTKQGDLRIIIACEEYTKQEQEHKMTNADRIRAMSDEELNDLFREIYNAGIDEAVAYEWGQYKNNFEWTMEWLKQPVETENVDRCVCCGAIIPEGQMVCPNCLVTVKERR